MAVETRRRNGQIEYKWPNGTWHSRLHSSQQATATINHPNSPANPSQPPAASPPPSSPPPPVVPPTGFYDPSLDAQLGQAQRGLRYLEQDTELAGSRAGQDLTFGLEGLRLGRDRGYEDIDRSVAVLTRNYGELQRQQAERARSMGVTSPGLALKAARIRAQNMAFDRAPLDTARTRLGQDFDVGSGRLGVEYGRGVTDRGTALQRGRDEAREFGLAIDAQRLYQAGQAGWVPPPAPRGSGGGGGSGGASALPPLTAAPGMIGGTGVVQAPAAPPALRVRNGVTEYRWPDGSWRKTRPGAR